MIKVPPKMLEEIYNIALQQYQLNFLKRRSRMFAPLEEGEELEFEIKVDTRGWPYAERLDKKVQEQLLLQNKKNLYDTITLVLFSQKKGKRGWWSPETKELGINTSVEGSITEKNLHEAVLHELQHFTQWYASVAFGSFEGYRFGMPPKKVRDLKKDSFKIPTTYSEYIQDDTEFLPHLNTEIEFLKDKIDSLREPLSQQDILDIISVYVSQSDRVKDPKWKLKIPFSDFFRALKWVPKARAKYQKAISVLTKEILKKTSRQKLAYGWKNFPKGWTEESVKKWFANFAEGGIEGSFTRCVDKVKKHMKNPEGMCASAKDTYYGGTDWRGKKKASVQIQTLLESKYGVVLDLTTPFGDNPKIVEIQSFKVPKEFQGSGLGTQVMEDLVSWADQQGYVLALSPSSDFGSTKSRLVAFYRRFGFVPNKGRNKDFRTLGTYLRNPL